MKRIVAIAVLILVSHIPAVMALNRGEPKIACEFKGSDCAPPSTSYYSIEDPATGRALEVTHLRGPAGHSANVNYFDPATGNTSFAVDPSGSIRWSDGTEFTSDLTTAAWAGRAPATQGVFSAVYYVNGERKTMSQAYDLSNVGEDAKSALAAAGSVSLDPGKESLRDFWQTASSVIASPEAEAASGFRVSSDVVTHAPAGTKVLMTDNDRYDKCVQCAFSVIATGLAGAGIITACAVTVGLACVGALVAYFTSGYSFATGCAKCFDGEQPDKGGGVPHK